MFRRPPLPQARVPTDTVIPLHFFDDTPLWRAFILYTTFVFDSVLDPEKLKTSLETLAQRDGWRKLGARLRSNKTGELEYHSPAEFTKDRPAIAFSHVVHDMSTADHPIACRLPKPSLHPSTVCDPDDFRSFFHPEGAPTKLDHYLKADRPQLGLHIVSFNDKTLVTLYWPHTLFDALGQRTLLNAWTKILEGSADEVQPPYGSDFDPLAKLGTNPTEPHKLLEKRLGLLGLAQYGMYNLRDFMNAQENRMVCIPASFVAQLHKEAMADLSSLDEAPSFLSESDVLTAWWTRLAITHLPRDSRRTVVLNNALSMRSALAGDLLPPADNDPGYLSDAVCFVNVLLPASDIFSNPLAYVAASIRSAITELNTRAQIEAFASIWRSSSGKLPPFFGNAGMHMITFSNWCKAKLFDLDFSAAVTSVPGLGHGGPGTKVGRPSYIQNNQFGLTLPNGFPIIGKDGEGNYWLSGYMNKGHWGKIEEALSQC